MTHADRPCFLPDQVGVYNRVYLPLAIVTILYLFITNIRSAWQRWNAAGHSVYGDLKNRASPAHPVTEVLSTPTTIRRISDRPVPLTLPSRKSSQYLAGGGSLTSNSTSYSRPNRLGSGLNTIEARVPRSAPVSPERSPPLTYNENLCNKSNISRADDEESISETPDISRHSSFIYMRGGPDLTSPIPMGQEPPSYFLPMPNNAGTGLGLSMPSGNGLIGGQGMRRTTSSTSFSGISPSQAGSSIVPTPSRRVTMPRMVSTYDWSAAAKAKEKSMFGFMVDSLAIPGLSVSRGRDQKWRPLQTAKGFVRWLWKARNGMIVVKSWREMVAVAWPPSVVWVVVNALFFLG